MRSLQLRFLVLVGIATFFFSALLLIGLIRLIPDSWSHPDWLFDAAVYTSLALTAVVVAWFVRREGRKNRESQQKFDKSMTDLKATFKKSEGLQELAKQDPKLRDNLKDLGILKDDE